MFGKLIGAGVGGFVFDSTLHENHCYKIVALPERPLKFYGLKSEVGRVYAMNENQADLFRHLAKQDKTTSALPEVYNYYEGENNRNLMEATRQENFYLPLPVGQSIAVWEMEKIPCISFNNFCDVQHPQKNPLENPQYQSLLHYLLNEGWVVRDIASDDNYGYRRNGEQVWFDPVVAPWPKGGITPAMKNSSNPTKANQYDSFVAAYGSNQLSLLRQSINDKRYFGYYHQGGVLHAEEIEEEFEPDLLNPKLFYDTWAEILFQVPEYSHVGAINFRHSPELKRKAIKAAYQFWKYFYGGSASYWGEEDSYFGIIQDLMQGLGEDEDKNNEAQELFDSLRPNNLIKELVYFTTNTTQQRVYGHGMPDRYKSTMKTIPPDLDGRQYQTLLDRGPVIAAQMYSREEAYGSAWSIWPKNDKYPPLCSYKDFILIQEEAFYDSLLRLVHDIDYANNCEGCGGDGIEVLYGPQGQEHEKECGSCDGQGSFPLDVKYNNWVRELPFKNNILQQQLYGYDDEFLRSIGPRKR